MQQNTEQPVYKLHNQDFKYIRDWLLQRGYIFNDPHFKLNNKYEWLRPSKITEEPQLFFGETTQHDVIQAPGELSAAYCALIAAMSALAFHPELVKQVVPSDQSFYDKYAGIFHFRFWRFGRWYDVVVDDRLPTLKGKLAFIESPTNAFWPVLLLKAYFKFLYGEYQDKRGFPFEVSHDFTGGIVQVTQIYDDLPITFEKTLLKAFARQSLVCCGIYGEAKSHLGLLSQHAYTITGARTVSVPGRGEVLLIRIRNPWGKTEWKGAWSDGSREWELVPKDVKEELAVVNRNEGEFVMEFSDFKLNFEFVDICYLSPNVYLNAYGHNTEVGLWHLDMVKGSWIKDVTAGGLEFLHWNPQIRFKLNEADGDNDGECSVLIALLRKRSEFAVLGFKVYRISDLNQPALDDYFFKNNQPVGYVSSRHCREAVNRCELKPGAYCVIPFTEKGINGDFLLRIYTEKKPLIKDSDSTKVGLSPEDVQDHDAPVSQRTTETIKDYTIDQSITDYFLKVSGPNKEVDWKDLKNVLDFGLKKPVSPAEENSEGWGHFLFDAATFIYNKVLEPTCVGSALGKTTGGYSYDLCRSMVALLDTDHSGKLEYNEFQALWNMIKTWESIYELYSDKATGYLNSSSLQNALEALNLNVGHQIRSSLIRKYATRDGYISFEDFMHCVIKIKSMTEFFKSKDESTSQKILLTFEELIGKVLYS